MEQNPIQNDVRRARRGRKLGANAACLLCGETTPEALRLVRRSLLEPHHVVGAANGPDLTVPLCRNCHAKVTEDLQAHGVDLRHIQGRNLLETIAAILKAAGAFLITLGQKFLEWGERLLALMRALDMQCPQWHQIPEGLA